MAKLPSFSVIFAIFIVLFSTTISSEEGANGTCLPRYEAAELVYSSFPWIFVITCSVTLLAFACNTIGHLYYLMHAKEQILMIGISGIPFGITCLMFAETMAAPDSLSLLILDMLMEVAFPSVGLMFYCIALQSVKRLRLQLIGRTIKLNLLMKSKEITLNADSVRRITLSVWVPVFLALAISGFKIVLHLSHGVILPQLCFLVLTVPGHILAEVASHMIYHSITEDSKLVRFSRQHGFISILLKAICLQDITVAISMYKNWFDEHTWRIVYTCEALFISCFFFFHFNPLAYRRIVHCKNDIEAPDPSRKKAPLRPQSAIASSQSLASKKAPLRPQSAKGASKKAPIRPQSAIASSPSVASKKAPLRPQSTKASSSSNASKKAPLRPPSAKDSCRLLASEKAPFRPPSARPSDLDYISDGWKYNSAASSGSARNAK